MNEKNATEDNLVYEIGFHLLPTADESEALKEFSGLKSLIEENEGAVISEEVPKITGLSYEISKNIDTKKQKFNQAYFGWVKFEIDPSKIAGIKSKIENIRNVLRFIIIKTVKEDTIHVHKIPMFKKESAKEDKGGELIERPKASEAEIDKSIDDLVIEN